MKQVYTYEIADWKLRELGWQRKHAVETSMNGCFTVIRETEKAVLLECYTEYGRVSTWCPKSAIGSQVKEVKTDEPRRMSGLEYHEVLVKFAKENHIKGARKNSKSDTLIDLIRGANLELPSRMVA